MRYIIPPNPVLLTLLTFIVGVAGWYILKPSPLGISFEAAVQQRIEDMEVRGFIHVVQARDGELVSVEGFLDHKGACQDVGESQRLTCTAGFSGPYDTGYMAVRLNICSDTVLTDCIEWPQSIPVDFRDVFVRDSTGDAIDFDGQTLLEPPNSWISYPREVVLTGRVTTVNGVGKFIEPIIRIEEKLP